jgi:hypothetical protein
MEEINIGDEVLFDSSKLQHNYDEYWIVKGKNEEKKDLYLVTPPIISEPKYWTIHISEVRQRLPTSKNVDSK